MKTIISFFFVLFLSFYALGQTSEPKTIRWAADAPHSDSVVVSGGTIKIIYFNKIAVAASLIDQKGLKLHAFLTIENKQEKRVLVDPSDWTLNVIAPKPKILVVKDADKLARSIEKRAAIASAINSAGAGMATEQSTATVRNSDGSSSNVTVTQPSGSAANRASRENAERESSAGGKADYIRNRTLLANTLFPGDQISGNVWFEDDKYTELILTIHIDGVAYEFPFTKSK